MAAQIRYTRFFGIDTKYTIITKSLIYVGLLVLILSPFQILSQSEVGEGFLELDYTAPQQFTIASVNVKGTESRDQNAIKSITGLREGTVIVLPSSDLSKGIKKLWNLGIFFSDVSLVLE